MPGTDPGEAMRVVAGELPDFPYLPELPARGPGADVTGRTAALLVDLPVETTTRGWRIAERPGRDLRVARSLLAADLDALEEVMVGYAGPLKIAVCGPWTLAATLELPRRLDVLLTDPGAVADLTASLAEGVAAHVAEVQRRVPTAGLVVQVDEPALAAVAAGTVPTASGLATLPAVDVDLLTQRLHTVLDAADRPTVVHCCATPIPFDVVTAVGADGIAFDLRLLRGPERDAVGELAEADRGLLLGVLDPTGRPDPLPPPRATAEQVARLWRELGLPPQRCARQVVLTPTCGLAGTAPDRARAILAHCRQAARILPELVAEQT